MPKRNPTKPKPDPLAKVSAPNLRRMVKRLRTDERRLTRVCQSHHERYLQTLARVMHLEDQLAEALINQVPPDDTPTTVVVSVRDESDHWTDSCLREAGWIYLPICPQYRYAIEQGGEPTGTAFFNNLTTHAEVPPPFGVGMPGATLPQHEVYNSRVAWSWWYWRPYSNTLTCPAVAASVEGRKALIGAEAVVVWPAIFGIGEACVWYAPPSLANIRVPPLTWRPA